MFLEDGRFRKAKRGLKAVFQRKPLMRVSVSCFFFPLLLHLAGAQRAGKALYCVKDDVERQSVSNHLSIT